MGVPVANVRESLIKRFLGNLRFPQLFLLAGGLFLADMVVPDLIPFADEVFLGVLMALLASFKNRRSDDLTPPSPPPQQALPPSST